MMPLDLNFVRSHFPSLNNEWIFFDNAGGAQVPESVISRITEYLLSCNVQHGASYLTSREAVNRIDVALHAFSDFINARYKTEIVLGASTTQLLLNLATSFGQTLKQGDEIIVSNSDHEANIGPWVNLQKIGINIKFWNINPSTFLFDINELKDLLTDRTRLIAITHASNILGHINPIKEIVNIAHTKRVLVCVDGVGYAPHRKIDVQDLGADFYCFSFYKVFGPHQALLYIRQEILERLPGINHFFIDEKEHPYKLQPGNINFELTYGSLGIIDYFKLLAAKHNLSQSDTSYTEGVFSLIAQHEEMLCKKLLSFLTSKTAISIIGTSGTDPSVRLPIISFIVKNKNSGDIVKQVDMNKIGIRYGDFYARRLIRDLDLNNLYGGVVRVSLAHYNSEDEIDKLIHSLDMAC